MRFCFGYKSVDDLKPSPGSVFSSVPKKEMRKEVKIAVIDDEKFEAGHNLRNRGYDIVEIGDPTNIDSIKEYPIILCDLMGVGQEFDTRYQGASLILEIRRNYPATVVAAYTGSSKADELALYARRYADRVIQKDAEIETWIEELDSLINIAANPKDIWKRVRLSLVDRELPTKEILALEDAFVRSLSDRGASSQKVEKILSNKNISDLGADILKLVISSTIVSLLIP